ncbi:MarR family winged helix-turn-helix transcriptional regulator [Quadrisphaera sp. INWT6]|uniref:MarR family winged helix-turn-helix transcriptional regulator n=1 Tax=Quadrisphaera sp. INWT6 TaxID=2596917 RepID=UPI0018924A14|nr:winged helix-turn-helix transcriptional regulator [Quadrisphaera sp. INWT6]
MGSTELADALMRAARGLRRGWHAGLEPSGLSPHQARALHVLGGGRGRHSARSGDAADGMRISELAAALRIAPRSATEVVDGLAEKGLAERGPDLADRRAVVVRLTDAGTATLAHADRARAEAAAELFGRLDETERADLTRMLRRLAD